MNHECGRGRVKILVLWYELCVYDEKRLWCFCFFFKCLNVHSVYSWTCRVYNFEQLSESKSKS